MATVPVQVHAELQKGETDEAKRTICYPVTTGEVSTTEHVSKAGGELAVSSVVQAVVDGTVAKIVVPTADLDTLGELVYKLQGATDLVYVSGIKVRLFDPYVEGALSESRLSQRHSTRP